jgi:hypothetical protein
MRGSDLWTGQFLWMQRVKPTAALLIMGVVRGDTPVGGVSMARRP